MNLFQECKTLDQAKKRYWELAKEYHPDTGGRTADFQELQSQFEKFRPEEEKYRTEFDDWSASVYMDILEQLIKIPEIIIEICGSWIWVSGNTRAYKDAIRSVDTGERFRCGFSGRKGMWYFSPAGYRKKSKAELSIDAIRDLYGSRAVSKEEEEKVRTVAAH